MIDIYTDGSCRAHKSKKGGWAYLTLINGELIGTVSGMAENTTNQRMELTAVIKALSSLNTKDKIHIYTDSAYVVNCIHKQWYVKWIANDWRGANGTKVSNKDLWEQLLSLLKDRNVEFTHIYGHGKNENERHNIYNNTVDRAANFAIV